MQSTVVEKPYTFLPPHRGNRWPSFIQFTRAVDFYLRRKQGVVSYDCRHGERLRQSLDAGHGIVLAPNHCRYADPLALGWLARQTKTHVYAMASRHLFDAGALMTYAMRKMGAFSVWREGLDRQSIETAIEIVATADRPLILFPEGSTFRSNDRLQPLLEGVSFIARTAARRRAKTGGTVVMHPVAIKYVFQGDLQQWAAPVLERLERQLTWNPRHDMPLIARIARLAAGWLAVKEVEFLGAVSSGALHDRATRLIAALVEPIEQQWNRRVSEGPPVPRIKSLRTKLVPVLLSSDTQPEEAAAIRDQLRRLDVAQQLASYPEGYLTEPPVTETRVLETIQSLEEDLLEKSQWSWPGPLHVILEVGEAFTVDAQRLARNAEDPLLVRLRDDLSAMLGRLQNESRLYVETSSADSSPAWPLVADASG